MFKEFSFSWIAIYFLNKLSLKSKIDSNGIYVKEFVLIWKIQRLK